MCQKDKEGISVRRRTYLILFFSKHEAPLGTISLFNLSLYDNNLVHNQQLVYHIIRFIHICYSENIYKLKR